MAPDVKAAIPLHPYVVRVVFSDGEVRDVDIGPLLSGPVFGPLRDPEGTSGQLNPHRSAGSHLS